MVLHEGFEVIGRVLDETRSPLANVRVYAQQMSGMLAFDLDDHETTVTDAVGRFAIPSAVGMHTFIAIDGEHAPTATPALDIDRATTDIEIVLKPGGVYAGRVVDADGRPAAGATVHVDTNLSFGRSRVSTTCDANGEFAVRALPRSTATAHAARDGAQSDRVPVELDERAELHGQTLVLERSELTAGAISGVVVDDTGAVAANVVVNISTLRESPHADEVEMASSTRTNQRGEFTFADLAARPYELWAGAYDRRPFPAEAASYLGPRPASSFVTIAKPGDTSVSLVVARTGSITAKVTFADDGADVPTLEVIIDPADNRAGHTCGQAGRFELRDIRPGTYNVRVFGRGFLDATARVQVEPGTTTDLGTIAVDRGRSITGTVVDTSGRPVAGARVTVGDTGGLSGMGRLDEWDDRGPGAVTDDAGAFSIVGGIGRRRVSHLIVGADHWSIGRSLPVAIAPGMENPPPITLTLRECGSIVGRVTHDGKPFSHAIIGAGWPEFGAAHADDDGVFVLPRLPAGTVALRVHEMDIMKSYQRVVEVEAGKRVDVTIDVPARANKLAVTLRPKIGEHVEGAKLFLFRGTVSFESYAEVLANIFPECQAFGYWEGDTSKPVVFDSLIPGDYTVCTMPLAWSPTDMKQMRRLQSAVSTNVKIYCARAQIAAAPREHELSIEVPPMAPPL